MASELPRTIASLGFIGLIFGVAFLKSPIRDDYLWQFLLQVFLFGVVVFVAGVHYGMSRGQQ